MPDYIDRETERLLRECKQHVIDANEHLDRSKLTNDQKFALAWFAGIPSRWKRGENQQYHLITEKCDFEVRDGKWVVIKLGHVS